MRLTINHDVHGTISSVVASPPDSGVMYIGTRPGEFMTEVERQELTLDQGGEHLRKHLTDVINNHLVATKTNQGRLTKKPALRAEDTVKTSFLTNIEAIVGDGRAVISADDSNILTVVQATIRSGKSASFYLSRDQANALRAWYWTPERVKASGIKVVSREEKARIESELGIENVGSFRCTRVSCSSCGDIYGAFEFLQQGIQEHGIDAVRAVFALKNSTVFRVNPSLVLVCPNCKHVLDPSGLTYEGDTYGGCCFGEEE